jgi:hypothetical protein
MKKLFTILIVISLVSICFAETLDDSTITVTGRGSSVIGHQSTSVIVKTNDGNFNADSNRRSILSVGNTRFETSDNTNNQYHNTLDSSDQVVTEGAALVTDKYVMEDNKDIEDKFAYLDSNATPSYQYVEAEFIQVDVDGARYKSAGVVDDANITTSMVAEGNHGSITQKYSANSKAGFSVSDNKVNFEKSVDGSLTVFGNDTGYEDTFDWTWKDTSNPFEVINNTTSNEGPIINVSAG